MGYRHGFGALALAGVIAAGLPAVAGSPQTPPVGPAPLAEAGPAPWVLAHWQPRQAEERELRREERLGLTFADRRNIQLDLYILGFDPRGIDGIIGPRTRNAISRWQRAEDLPVTGYLREGQLKRLERQAEARKRELQAESEAARREAERQDNAYWQATGASGREGDLRTYLRRYPDGIHAPRARQELAAIEQERDRQARVEERSAWNDAVRADSVAGYRRYLTLYPSGLYVGAAQARIEDLQDRSQDQAQNERQREREEALGLNQASRRSVEQRLASLGFDSGRADGEFDRETRQAIRAFQRTRGIAVTGFLNEPTLARLVAETR